jgi:hypothetical protein
MQFPDLINGLFETCGSLAVFENVRVLYKHKVVRGSSLKVSVFFTTFGLWNLYYYAHLSQWISWSGGAVLCIGNLSWFSMAAYYMRKENQHARLLELSAKSAASE